MFKLANTKQLQANKQTVVVKSLFTASKFMVALVSTARDLGSNMLD